MARWQNEVATNARLNKPRAGLEAATSRRLVALSEDAGADALLLAIVNLAKTLGMSVIAEGVETPEQWLRINTSGCEKIQGYIASRPLQADNVVPFLQSKIPTMKAPGTSNVPRQSAALSVVSGSIPIVQP